MSFSPFAILGLVVSATLCCAAETTVVDKQDIEFVHQAAVGGLWEVKSSELALKRGTLSPDERTFAQRMIDDHTKVNDQLSSLATAKGLSVPKALDEGFQKRADKLAAVKDADFPAKYLKEQVATHKEAVELFEEQSKDGKDPALKQFAAENIHHLKSHLEMVQALEAKR